MTASAPNPPTPRIRGPSRPWTTIRVAATAAEPTRPYPHDLRLGDPTTAPTAASKLIPAPRDTYEEAGPPPAGPPRPPAPPRANPLPRERPGFAQPPERPDPPLAVVRLAPLTPRTSATTPSVQRQPIESRLHPAHGARPGCLRAC